jgi:hypothetical protein
MSKLITTAAACVAVLVFGASAYAQDGCKSYSGAFTAVPPASCPGIICTHGTLVGGFPSTYDFVATSLFEIAYPIFGYAGYDVITTPKGAQLFGSDSGQISVTTGEFVTTVEIVGGMRQYEGATGEFVAPGVLDFATGDTSGTYTATICKAEDVQGAVWDTETRFARGSALS